MKKDLKKLYIATFFVYISAVAALCFLRPESLPSVDKDTFLGIPIDKILHFLMFMPFPVLSGLAFIRKKDGIGISTTMIIILSIVGAATAYGTEIIQSQTGYRSYEIADFYADLIGISAGALAVLAYIVISKLK